MSGVRRRFPTPVQIFLLLAIAGLVAVWLRTSSRPPTDTAGNPPTGAPAFDLASVREVVYERPASGFRARVVREADGFWMVEPYRDRADDAFLAQSLQVAATIRPLRTLPDTTRDPFGLRVPSARLIVSFDGRPPYRVDLGDSIPAGGGRFAIRTGSPSVAVLDPFLARRYLAPPGKEIQSPIAAPLAIGPPDSIVVQTREEMLKIARRGKQSWSIVEPVRAAASAPELERAIEALRSESLTSFLGPSERQDLPSLGLDPPRAVWTLHQSGRPFLVRIGHATADQRSVYVIPSGRDVVALLPSDNFRTLVDGSARLRENLLIPERREAPAGVELAEDGRTRRFERTGERWSPAGGALEPADEERFRAQLQNLLRLRAGGFRPGARSDLERPLQIVLRFAGGDSETLAVGLPHGDRSVAWSSAQPGLALVPPALRESWSRWLEGARPLP
ncbi:MAG: DUF4340 domain-containing protein [Candidatus Eisenbacteria bacterium]